MPVANGSFEIGTGGQLADWSVASSGAAKAFAEFHQTPHPVGFEQFGATWSGIYAYWHLDEEEGTTVADSSGNGRDGVTVNMEDDDWELAKVNNGLRFDGVDEYVDFGFIAEFEKDDAFGLELWFYHEDKAGARDLLGKWDGSKGYLLFLDATKKLGFKLTGPTGSVEVTTATSGLVLGWHHAVITYSGSGTAAGVHIYLDNVDETLSVIADNLTTSILTNASFRLADCGSSFSPTWGVQDEVLVYDKELDSEEAKARWNSGSGTGEIPSYVDMTLKTSYSGYYVDLDLPIFNSGPGQEDHEEFEKGWGAFLSLELSRSLASFGAVPEDFDSFENGWGDVWWTLSQTLAIFDSGLTPQAFEDFENGFGLGTQELKKVFGVGDLEDAEFDEDGSPEKYESFEDAGWTVLTP